jgi:hypothetical protein
MPYAPKWEQQEREREGERDRESTEIYISNKTERSPYLNHHTDLLKGVRKF